MAGHSQFANIKHRKDAQDSKRAKLFTKILREITVSVKEGMPDPEFNPRLRNAISAAQEINIPKDRIEAAVKRATSGLSTENYDEIRYEGYAPGGIALMVEALTDNRNRTASEVRSLFTKFGGTLGETNSVAFLFDKIGVIEFDKTSVDESALFEAAIESGAMDVESSDDCYFVITDPENFASVRDEISKKFNNSKSARLIFRAKDSIELTSQDQISKITKLVDCLEDCDDVQNVIGNYIINEGAKG